MAGIEERYLLDRGYSQNSVLDLVSRRHELRVRQRLALQRSLCSGNQQRARTQKCVAVGSLRGGVIEIDGFNLIIGLEVALSGGLLIRCQDGALRDLAGLRGSYHLVEETERALGLLAEAFGELGIAEARFYLDRPVSNSGRLRARILERTAQWPCRVEVSVVSNPDRELIDRSRVVSSDSAVLDRAASWANLLGYLVESRIESTWLIDLTIAEPRHETLL